MPQANKGPLPPNANILRAELIEIVALVGDGAHDDVAIGDDAAQLALRVADEHVADLLIAHQPRDFTDRRVLADAVDGLGHYVLNLLGSHKRTSAR